LRINVFKRKKPSNLMNAFYPLLLVAAVVIGVLTFGPMPMREPIQTGEISGINVSYFPNATGYFVEPASEGNYPGIVLIHENRGLRPEIKMAAEDLAKEGYKVLAVDLLGPPVETQAEARNLTARFNQTIGTANMRAAVQYLRDQGATRIGSWGWCFGGRQSVNLAISGEPLDATVVYYGGGMATNQSQLAPIKWPVLGVFGGNDTSIPLEMVGRFETSLDSLGVENEIYIYPGVGHAFANPSNPNHAPAETADAWSKTLAFLDKHLKTYACTLEAKACPDGSYAGRTGPNCEFELCPGEKRYVLRDPEQCKVAKFYCSDGSPFFDDEGCGCAA
jgi:carboxymethylenebutenolidase